MKPAVFSIPALALLLAPTAASAETVMQKIARTGVLTAGTNKEAAPFAYADRNGQLQGYSIDMLKLIQKQAEQELGRSVKLKLVALTPANRIPSLISGQVDVVCDFSSFTWQRNRQIDFSMSYATSGTQLLAKRGSAIGSKESLIGQRVGVLPGTTNEVALKKFQPRVQPVYFQQRTAAYAALRQGKIAAFASDSLLLEALLSNNQNSEFKITGGLISKEGIGCMVPEDNSKFLDTVNLALFRHMQGAIRKEPSSLAILDRWFGAQSPLPMSNDFKDMMLETMQLAVDAREEID
jgi:polar amino acid transport system substrate-binding protein